MGRTKCIFCRKTTTRSKEHVWPQWLEELLGVQGKISAWVHRSVTGNAVSRRIQNTASIVLGQVCGECNNGWMSELENQVRPLVQSMLPGVIGRTLSAADAGTLARWAFKTAIVLNAASNYRHIVPEAHYAHLYSTRQVPARVVVDASSFHGNLGVTSVQSQHLNGVIKGDALLALDQIRRSGYNIGLGVGPIAFRVAHLPIQDHILVTDIEQPNRTRRLLPATKAVTFDPVAGFDDLQDFAMALTFRHEA